MLVLSCLCPDILLYNGYLYHFNFNTCLLSKPYLYCYDPISDYILILYIYLYHQNYLFNILIMQRTTACLISINLMIPIIIIQCLLLTYINSSCSYTKHYIRMMYYRIYSKVLAVPNHWPSIHMIFHWREVMKARCYEYGHIPDITTFNHCKNRISNFQWFSLHFSCAETFFYKSGIIMSLGNTQNHQSKIRHRYLNGEWKTMSQSQW